MFSWMAVCTEGFLSKQQHPFTIKYFHRFQRQVFKDAFGQMHYANSTITEEYTQFLQGS